MARSLKAAVQLTRPVNLLITALGVLVGILVGPDIGLLSAEVLEAMGAAVFITAGGNTLNDVFDQEIDARIRADKPIPSGYISTRSAKFLAGLEYATGLFLASLLTVPAFAIAALNTVLLLAYEKGLKSRGILGNLTISYLVGSIFLFGSLALIPTASLSAVILFCLAFSTNLAREIVKDAEDLEADIGFRKTVPMQIGIKNSLRIGKVLLILSIFLSLLPIWLGFGNIYIALVAVADLCFLVSIPIMWKDLHLSSNFIKGGMLIGVLSFLVEGIL